MESYKVIPIKNKDFDHLIISNSYKNPINDILCSGYFPDVNSGNVIFDLAIINGLSHNRFISVTVKEHKLLPNTIKIATSIPREIIQTSKDYFIRNIKIVENSVIPQADKFLLTQ